MRDTDLSVLIKKSFRRMRDSLFKPFVLKKWLYFMLIAFLSGNLGGGCGNGRGSWGKTGKKAEAAPTHVGQTFSARGEVVDITPEDQDAPAGLDAFIKDNPFKNWREWPSWVFVLVIMGGLLVLALLIFFSWVNARFQFVWLNAVVHDEAAIRKPFREYKEQGNSLFKFYVAYGLFLTFVFAVLAASVIGPLSVLGAFDDPGRLAPLDYIKICALPALLFGLLNLAGLILIHFVNQFIVPIMAADRSLFTQGWRKFLDVYRKNTKDIWVYLLTSFGLSIASAVILGIGMLILFLAFGLAAAVIGGILYVIFGLLLKSRLLFGGLMVLAGLPALAALFVLTLMFPVPVAVFFRNFSLYYLASLDCPYRPL